LFTLPATQLPAKRSDADDRIVLHVAHVSEIDFSIPGPALLGKDRLISDAEIAQNSSATARSHSLAARPRFDPIRLPGETNGR